MNGGLARPAGLLLLIAFFLFGTLVSGLTLLMLLIPGPWADPIWRLKPSAQADFQLLGMGGPLLMLLVSAACAGAAVGLWRRQRWGYWLAVGILATNLLGDIANAIFRQDWRALIGVPIGGAILLYLTRPDIRNRFVAAG
jgi:hypothetical protein